MIQHKNGKQTRSTYPDADIIHAIDITVITTASLAELIIRTFSILQRSVRCGSSLVRSEIDFLTRIIFHGLSCIFFQTWLSNQIK